MIIPLCQHVKIWSVTQFLSNSLAPCHICMMYCSHVFFLLNLNSAGVGFFTVPVITRVVRHNAQVEKCDSQSTDIWFAVYYIMVVRFTVLYGDVRLLLQDVAQR